jgi:hypothetical protein
MRKFATLTGVTVFLGLASAAANATSIGPITFNPQTDFIRVAEGCAAGWHRGPNGHCVRNYAPHYVCHWVYGPFPGRHRICHRY